MKMFFRKNWAYLILALIVVLATAIRIYHLQTWLHFQADQARDAMVVRKAIQNGISSLPLLGPRAGGTLLRLGPAFYYFEYLSAKIAGSIQPLVLAYPDIIFGTLTVPLFYFFLRLYFRKISSLLGTTLYAFSFIAVQYSRFAWNPNSVPFWTLFFLFSLVKFGRAEKEKEKYVWAALGALALGIASQLHFMAYISFPIIAIAFLVWSKAYRNLNFRRVALVLAILVILYIPVILSEAKTGGSNTLQFVSTIGGKSSDNTLGQKIHKTVEANSQYYFFLLTSYKSLTNNDSPFAGIVFIAASLLLIFFKFRRERDENRKLFLRLIFVWFAVSFLLIFPFTARTHPRFFLTVYFLPLIFFIFWIEGLLDFFRRKKYQVTGILVSTLLTLFILVLNLEAVFAGFQGAAADREPKIWNNRSNISSEIEKIPLYQIRKAADYLAERSRKEHKNIHLGGNMTYRASIQYLLKLKSSVVDFENMSRLDDERDDLYFTVADDEGMCYGKTKELVGSELTGAYFFGHRFALCELKLLPDFETSRAKISPEAGKETSPEEDLEDAIDIKARTRIFWRDLFN